MNQVPQSPVVSIILARGGSKGVPGKNLKVIAGVTLLERSIKVAQRANIKRTIVSSDSEEILNLAAKFGVEIHRRSDFNSRDQSTSEEAILEVLTSFGISSSDDITVVLLQVTSPFILSSDISRCLQEVDVGVSAFTAFQSHSYQWIEKFGKLQPLGHAKYERNPRQQVGLKITEAGSCYAFKVRDFFENRSRFANTVKPVLIPQQRSLEIDTFEDLWIAEILAKESSVLEVMELNPSTPKLIFCDFDGCLTDNRVVLNEDGLESVSLSRVDGLYIELIKNTFGVNIEVISRETNPVVLRRCEKLNIIAHVGVENKKNKLDQILDERNLEWSDVWYIGDELNDLECLRASGLSMCPLDSNQIVRNEVDIILSKKGGEGIFLEVSRLLEELL